MDSFSGGITQSNLVCLPNEKGSILKGTILLPFFPLEYIPFQKGLGMPESKVEIIKVASFATDGGNLPSQRIRNVEKNVDSACLWNSKTTARGAVGTSMHSCPMPKAGGTSISICPRCRGQ